MGTRQTPTNVLVAQGQKRGSNASSKGTQTVAKDLQSTSPKCKGDTNSPAPNGPQGTKLVQHSAERQGYMAGAKANNPSKSLKTRKETANCAPIVQQMLPYSQTKRNATAIQLKVQQQGSVPHRETEQTMCQRVRPTWKHTLGHNKSVNG